MLFKFQKQELFGIFNDCSSKNHDNSCYGKGLMAKTPTQTNLSEFLFRKTANDRLRKLPEKSLWFQSSVPIFRLFPITCSRTCF